MVAITVPLVLTVLISTLNVSAGSAPPNVAAVTVNVPDAPLLTVNDYATEGAQTFTVSVRTGSVSGTVLATSSSVTVNDTSTTVSASGAPTSFNEGASTTITASATGFPNGTYFWTVLNGTTTAADFTATSGSFAVSYGVSGAFTVTAATLGGAEAAETFQVQIRTVSTSGTVIATTGALTINANAT